MPANHVRVAGLLQSFPRVVIPTTCAHLTPRIHRNSTSYLRRKAPSIHLALPAPGLYDITITDAPGTRRASISLSPPSVQHSLQNSKILPPRPREVMEEWNEDYAGWPIHDFLRAYLQSLMQSGQAFPAAEAR